MEKEEKKEKLIGGATPAQINKWKEVYGEDKIKKIYIPTSETADDYLEAIARVPDRKMMGEVEKNLEKDPYKAKDIMVKAFLLTHKEEVLADDGLFAGAVDAISKLIVVRTAIVKNL